MLEPGLSYSFELEITPDLSPPHLAPMVVLSTPNMILNMEIASLQAVQQHIGETETTVGTHVNVSHAAAAQGGEIATVASELESIDRRRLNFKVSVMVGDRVIGEGTHQRAIIDTSRFG